MLVALVHEDVGIITAGFFVAERGMPFALALAIVYAGVLTNNLGIYSLGNLARRVPAARRRLIGAKIEAVGRALKTRAVSAVLLCRFAPGFLLPTFLGCGWFAVPFPRFAPAAAFAAAVYVSVMLTLVVTFGRVVVQRASEGAWVVLAAVAVVAIIIAARRRVAGAWQRRG